MQQDDKPKLVLIRGLPGSGKSTIARAMAGYENYEADMFFTLDEKYVFSLGDLKTAHRWCLHRTKTAIESGRNVVVSNTFSQLWEMEPYLALRGCEISVITAVGDFPNVHNVHRAAIEVLRKRWEPYP